MKRFCIISTLAPWTSRCFVPAKRTLVPKVKRSCRKRWLRNILLLFVVCSGFFLFQPGVVARQNDTHPRNENSSESKPGTTEEIVLQAHKLYARLDTSPKGMPLSLKTSIVTLSSTRKNKKVHVHLVGAIHFADREYYRVLDKRLAQYEMVLFELVTDKNADARELLAKRKPGTSNDSPSRTAANNAQSDREPVQNSTQRVKRSPLFVVGAAQKLMSETLGLTSQLAAIDYGRDNMVHCDMDHDSLLKEILKGDDINTLIDELLLSFLEQEQGKELGILAAILFSRNKQITLRRLAAREIANQISPDKATLGQKSLIEARNSVVLDRIRRELDTGKKEIAVFYGAAHLPDFMIRLQTEYGFTFESCQWIEAWNMKTESKHP